jgi:hypothetical protein
MSLNARASGKSTVTTGRLFASSATDRSFSVEKNW